MWRLLKEGGDEEEADEAVGIWLEVVDSEVEECGGELKESCKILVVEGQEIANVGPWNIKDENLGDEWGA